MNLTINLLLHKNEIAAVVDCSVTMAGYYFINVAKVKYIFKIILGTLEMVQNKLQYLEHLPKK